MDWLKTPEGNCSSWLEDKSLQKQKQEEDKVINITSLLLIILKQNYFF